MNVDQLRVLSRTDDLPIKTARPVHSGKVRSVYFLTQNDSARLIEQRGYEVQPESAIAIMVISDRISAFDCAWHSQSMAGIPGKGAALNKIAAHWFAEVSAASGLAHHLLEMPHPMLWVVRQAKPLLLEAIARRFLTGSLWRAYANGERSIAGETLADGLSQYARFDRLLFTPSTKGVFSGLAGVPAYDDAPIAPELILRHFETFGLRSPEDLDRCRRALNDGFSAIEQGLARSGRLLVDTKFEFGLAPSIGGDLELLLMDEVGTPDSSRFWLESDWQNGSPKEYSKEFFRQALLEHVPDPELLLNPKRMEERKSFAASHALPDSLFEAVSRLYLDEATAILDHRLAVPERPREAILDVLHGELGLIP
ncbi:MAG: phosphoribosylaminoimidazolesuccinocarboxamide synthase [Pseudomonadota bacterium]